MGFHLVERRVRRGSATLRQAPFHDLEPGGELVAGALQAAFGVELQLAGEVGEHEQHVAEFVGQAVGIGAGQLRAQLGGFLGELVEHRARVRPVEADAGGAPGQLGRTGQRGQPGGHAGEGAAFGARLAFPLLLAGLGGGAVISPNQTPSLSAVPPRMGGAAGAVIQTGQRIGSALGAAVLVTAYQLGRGSGDPVDGLQVTLLTSLAILLVALGAAVWDLRRGN